MKYFYRIPECFKKNLKSLAKKFPHTKEDVIRALVQFEKETAVSLGKNNYKIRIKSSDLKKGKSNSLRMIIHVIEVKSLIIPIAIFFKSDRENISIKEINDMLEDALAELENPR